MRRVTRKPQEKASAPITRIHENRTNARSANPRATLSMVPIDTAAQLLTLNSAPSAFEEHPITMQSLRQRLRFLAAVQLLPALESGEETLVGGQAVLEGRHDALAPCLGHLHTPARWHFGDALGAAGTALGAAQMDGLANDSRRHDARPGDGAGLPRAALFSQRRHGRADRRRREENRGAGLGPCAQRRAVARVLHLHVQVCAACWRRPS